MACDEDATKTSGLCWVLTEYEHPYAVKAASRSWYALWMLDPGTDEASQPAAWRAILPILSSGLLYAY